MQITILASEGGCARETFRVFAVNRCFGVLWPCSGPFQWSERAKMRDEGSNNILFWTGILETAPSWQADMMPACHDGPGIEIPSLSGPRECPSSPFSNKVLKTLQFKTRCTTPACTIPLFFISCDMCRAEVCAPGIQNTGAYYGNHTASRSSLPRADYLCVCLC